MKYLLLILAVLCTIALPAPAQERLSPAPPSIPQLAPMPTLDELRQRLSTLEKRLAAGEIPADQNNLALLRFKLDQARLALQQIDRDIYLNLLDTQRYLAERLDRAEIVSRALGDVAATLSPTVHERAYIAVNDDSSQPYWVFLPKDYSARRQYPLVVFLHGYSPEISKAAPWIPDVDTWKLATERGFILAVPYGRRNSDFVGIGEDDTLAVTNEVKRLYSVDPARVFLLGPSMGGFGVYAVGLHNPHVWAGLTPMCGRTDFYLWFKLNRNTVVPWKRRLYDADNPRTLKANALNLPIYIQHGGLDTIVDPDHSRLFFADLKALGYAIRYREIPDGDHYIYWQASSYEMALDWAGKVRQTPAPKRVVYTTADLRNHRAYWVNIGAFEDYSRSAHIDVEIKPGNVIQVTAQNIARFTLEPPASRLEPERAITLKVNGVASGKSYQPSQPVQWVAAGVGDGDSGFPGVKSPQRSGPVKNCYRDPFLVVYGTLKAGLEEKRTTDAGAAAPAKPLSGDEANARRFLREWYQYADGIPPSKPDHAVTEEDRKRYNLILFGTRESNSILAQIADRLPVELTPTGYRIGSQQTTGSNLGMQLCYPSPFDARRMIVVQSGAYWGDALPINHKYDMLPDYIVYEDTVEVSDGGNEFDFSDQTNRAVVAGFFDGNWNLTRNPGTPDTTPSNSPPANSTPTATPANPATTDAVG